MERQTRYATTDDGVRIAYYEEGGGPPLLVCPGFVESFSLDELDANEAEFMAALAESHRLIRFDIRGTGLSQREADDLSASALMLDIVAVLRAAGVRQSFIWASTISGPQAILFAATYPRRTLGLMLYGTFARSVDVMPADAIKGMAEFVRKSPEFALGALIGNDPSSVNDAMRLAEVYRRSAEPEMIANILLQGSETDVTAKLSSIRCPAMVLHRLGDTVVPFAVGQALAARLPHATFISLPGSVHAYTTGDSGRVLEAIRGFTGTDGDVRVPRHAAAGHEPAFCTVLVTDLVGHTDMMQRLGDTRGRALLREYEQLTRATLKQHGGTEIKTLGDGFMASFSTVTKSIDCAIALQRAFAAYNASATEALNVRIGLNAGEPIAEHGDLFGSTVIMAARVAAKAGAGEILIPEPLRHLLTGKTYQYADRGETMLKGFEDAVRLYEVRWRA